MAGIYVHIPFCKSRCIYCDFFSTTQLGERDKYVDVIKRELEQRKGYLGENTRIDTIYFGGGTPSMLSAEQLCSILDHIRSIYNMAPEAEITAEGNPDDLSVEFLQKIRMGGFNRLSMGIQTFNNERLKFICRRHTADVAMNAVSNARTAGFSNISIDLMYGFPNESLADWIEDIEKALTLSPQHISAYSLMYEEGTRLYDMLTKGLVEEADEDLSLKMYETLINSLEKAGYTQYEISNFCQPDFHSRHNSSYWDGTPYLGIGAAAHSYDGKSRQWNTASLKNYMDGIANNEPIFEKESLTEEQLYNERIMTGLRTSKGVNIQGIGDDFGCKMEDYCMKCAQPHLEGGRLCYDTNKEYIKLTRDGLFVSDDIMSDLMK